MARRPTGNPPALPRAGEFCKQSWVSLVIDVRVHAGETGDDFKVGMFLAEG